MFVLELILSYELQPMIADLDKLGKSLSRCKFEGRNIGSDTWHHLLSPSLDLDGDVEYRPTVS